MPFSYFRNRLTTMGNTISYGSILYESGPLTLENKIPEYEWASLFILDNKDRLE